MFESIRKHAEREDLGSVDRGLTRLAVSQNAWKFGHFRDPTTVRLSFNFNGQWHS
jgi:hypothetical protein